MKYLVLSFVLSLCACVTEPPTLFNRTVRADNAQVECYAKLTGVAETMETHRVKGINFDAYSREICNQIYPIPKANDDAN